jgi:predicted translin family RNA/ssDNA-binding protein
MREYTPKQIAKYKRQKYISALNKCTTNLYKLFKNEATTYSNYCKRFKELKKEIDKYSDTIISGDYIKKQKEYIDKLYLNSVVNSMELDSFNDLKSSELSNLNRLQKMKNREKYSKDKYKKWN